MILLGLVALTSCQSLEKKENKNNDELIINTYLNKYVPNDYINDAVSKSETSSLKRYDHKNIEVKNLTEMYEGEEIYVNKNLASDVKVVKLFAKNPTFYFKEGTKKYNENSYSKKGHTEVRNVTGEDLKLGDKEKDDKYREVKVLDEYYLHALIKNETTGETKEIVLPNKINILDRQMLKEVENNTRYEDLKKGNGRVKYSISTIDKAYENEVDVPKDFPLEDSDIYSSIDEVAISYEDYYGEKKYYDEDDYVGKKVVTVTEHIDGLEDKKYKKIIDFGTKLEDYKDNFSVLLSNLEKTPLKFTETGEIEGGFDKYNVDKILRYAEAVENYPEVKFVTEITDKDKNTVGIHNIVRKITVKDKVVFEKKDRAFIGFPGLTVGVADGGFFDLTDSVEARTFRYTPKKYDEVENYIKEARSEEDLRKALQGLNRPHGSTVIGTMIDEVTTGGQFYAYGNFIKTLIEYFGVKTKLPEWEGWENKGYSDLNKVLGSNILNFGTKYADAKINHNDEFADRLKKATEKLDEAIQYVEDNNIERELTDTQKVELSQIYKDVVKLLEEAYMISEEEKLPLTNLHFSTITVGLGGSAIDSNLTGKNLSSMLEQNKNIKVVNMSYGSSINVDEYLKLDNANEQTYEKGAKAYNENPEFRQAVLSWLNYLDENEMNSYISEGNDYLGIPSVYKYFNSRDKITPADYKKLIQLRQLGMKRRIIASPEMTAANLDVLFVRAEGNTYSAAPVDLTEFNENGEKVIYQDANYKYNNDFTSLPTLLNYLEKKKAEEEGTEYKYNYNYRKNLLGAIGLVSKKDLAYGSQGTENLSSEYALYTDTFNYKKLRLYSVGMLSTYNKLIEEYNKIIDNPTAYKEGYKEEVLEKIKAIDELSNKSTELFDVASANSFTRAGESQLWTVATEGFYGYTKELDENEKKFSKDPTKKYGSNEAYGSSFAAPRTTAIAAEISEKFPWMSAHDIKTSILTTAIDDYRIIDVEKKDENGKTLKDEKGEDIVIPTQVGIYGVDKNIGWGVLNREEALKGPARFVKALTREVGQENFVANVPYGTYDFGNDIRGAFNPVDHMYSRGFISLEDRDLAYVTALYSEDKLLDKDFLTLKEGTEENPLTEDEIKENEKKTSLKKIFDKAGKTPQYVVNTLIPRLKEYIPSLPKEEKELFESAGLVKQGKGTLMLSGNNTYNKPTYVEDGTLVVRGVVTGDVVVSKDAKLKLDVARIENANVFRLIAGLDPIKGGIKGEVKNAGSLYSYSSKDKIQNTYKPLEGSQTRIAAIGTLTIDKLDLSNISHFDIDVFRKTGMIAFPTHDIKNYDDIEEEDIKISKEEEKKDLNRRLILDVKEISESQLDKISFGEKDISSNIKLIVEKVKNEDKTVGVKAYIERKDKLDIDFDRDYNKEEKDIENKTKELIEEKRKQDEEKKNASTSSLLRAALLESVHDELITLEEANVLLSDMDWFENEDALNGDILSDAVLLGFDISNTRQRLLKNELRKNHIDKKINVFGDAVVDINLRKSTDENKLLMSNIYGAVFGATYTTKYDTFGLSLDYTNSKLKDVRIDIEKEYIVNDKSEIETIDSKKVLGDVTIHGLGLTLINEVHHKGFYLDTLISMNYLSKKISRLDAFNKNIEFENNDYLINFNNELGYKYNHKFNDKFSLGLTPYVGLDYVRYLRDQFNEETDYAFKGDKKDYNKVNMTIGTKVDFNILDNININLFADYTKYLTDTNIATELELTNYKFTTNVKGINLEDNSVNFGVSVYYRPTKNVGLSFSYSNKNLMKNSLNAGIRFEF